MQASDSHTTGPARPQHEYLSVSDEDPNEAAFHPRRGASIRARSVIANACGVRKRVTQTMTVSRRIITKEEVQFMVSFAEDLSKELKDNSKLSVHIKTDTQNVERASKIYEIPDEPPFSSSSRNAQSTNPSTKTPIQKRSRQVFDCVLITCQSKKQKLDSVALFESILFQPAEDENGKELQKIKSWKNPKVKKNEDLALLPDTIRNRIRHIGFEIQDQYIDIDRLTREVMVTREFISHEYGGSTRPKIAQKFVDAHGMSAFYFINPDYDPQPPEVPGAPGLKLSTKTGPDKGRLRVMTKIKNTTLKHNNQYLYVGQYDVMCADPPVLSVQEWKAQSSKFHNKWAQGIVTQGWGRAVRCRIVGRRIYGREPTEEECKAVQESGRFTEVTKEEVKNAYFSGQEQMRVWTMKCVGYDNNFQRELSEKFSRWVPQTKDKKTKLKLKNDGDSDEEQQE